MPITTHAAIRKRKKMLIPDSAHGTNPASSAMIGLEVVQIPSDERGNVDLEALKAACDDTVVGMMLTNPNTLGLFDEHLEEVIQVVHDCGGLVYGDGANLNALLGIIRPGDLGFDLDALQPAQDLLHPARRRRPGFGSGGCLAEIGRFPAQPHRRHRRRRQR